MLKFMEDLQVNFISLVKKGANKKRYSVYKSAEKAQQEAEDLVDLIDKKPPVKLVSKSKDAVTKDGKDKVTKGFDKYDNWFPDQTSFKSQMMAKHSSERMQETKIVLVEYWEMIQAVIQEIYWRHDIDRAAASTAALKEFTDAVAELFSDEKMPVVKTSETKPGEGDNENVVQSVSKAEVNIDSNENSTNGGHPMAVDKNVLVTIQKSMQDMASGINSLIANVEKSEEEKVTPPPVPPVETVKKQEDPPPPSGSITEILDNVRISLEKTFEEKTGQIKTQIVKEFDKKISDIQGDITLIKKSAGLPNSVPVEKEDDGEVQVETVEKGDESDWAGYTDGYGSLRIK